MIYLFCCFWKFMFICCCFSCRNDQNQDVERRHRVTRICRETQSIVRKVLCTLLCGACDNGCRSNQETKVSNIEAVLLFLCRYLNRTAKHSTLRNDSDLREFLEAEGDLPRSTSTSALSGAGVMRLFSKVGDSFGKMTFKMDETDQVSVPAVCLSNAVAPRRLFTRYGFISLHFANLRHLTTFRVKICRSATTFNVNVLQCLCFSRSDTP